MRGASVAPFAKGARPSPMKHGEKLLAAPPRRIEKFALLFARLLFCGCRGSWREFRRVGQHADQSRIEGGAQGVVYGQQFEADPCVLEVGNAAPGEMIGETVPGLFLGSVEFSPIQKDVRLVGV